MGIFRWMVSAGAAFFLFQGVPLFAQPGGAVAGETAEMTDKARELYNTGSAALLKGRWGEAHASLLAAWSLKKHHQIAGNLAAAEMQLGRYREAAEHLAYYVREAPATKQKERHSAQALLADARKHIGALAIKVEPAGAEVLVDGVVVGKAPLSSEVFVEPGTWTIEARLDGYKTARATVEMAAGSAREVSLAVASLEAKRDPAAVIAPPKRTSEPILSTPPKAGGVPEAGGGDGAGGPRKEVLIAGLAASALGIGMGIGFSVVSNARANDAADLLERLVKDGGARPCLMPAHADRCGEVDSALAARDVLGDAAAWSFIGAGIAGASTVIYVLITSKRRVQAAPVVSAGAGGLVVSGTW